MSNARPASHSPIRQYTPDASALLQGLTAEQALAVEQLIRERDNLFLLHEALIEVEVAPSLEARLRIFGQAIQKIGFNRVVITLRDAELNPTTIFTAGLTEHEDRELRRSPAPGEVWRRRLAMLEPYRVSQSYYLDGRDETIAREFRGGVPSRLAPGDDPSWSPADSLLVPLKGSNGRLLATLVLDDPADRQRPSLARVRTVELFGQQVAYCIEQATLYEVASRRAARLQRLHEVGAVLARSLDEEEIGRELARQVQRVLPCDGVVVTTPDLEAGTITEVLRLVRGQERERGSRPLRGGPIAEAARTGRPVRVDDYDPTRVPLAVADDVVIDGGPAGSVLVVPMMLGLQLVGVLGVFSAAKGVYTPEDEEVLLTMGGQAATALVNARLYAESQRERRQSEALADVARAVSGSLRLSDVLRLTLRHATALLRVEGACISLRQGERTELEVVAGVGSGELLVGMMVPIDASMSGRALREGGYIISNAVLRESDAYTVTQKKANIRKTLIVPLVGSHGPIGCLSVLNRPTDFTDEDARVLQRLADHVAVAIVNARLFESAAEATREWEVSFDAIASGMVVLDADGRIVRSNARAVQLCGVDAPAELGGRSFHEAVLGEPEASPDCAPTRALKGEVARGTHRAARRGKIFDILAAPHPDGGAVVTFDDVTSHHILQERHRRVIETTRDAIVITDLQRRIAFANPAAGDLFGRSHLIGTPVRELVATELYEEVKLREERAIAGEPQRYECAIIRPDGERRLVAVSTSPLREVGQVTGIVASLRDVTAERRARDAVVSSEARYRNLFEAASDAIYTLDPRGAFTSLNQATCEVTGYAREELIGRSCLPLLAPDEVEGIKGHFRAALDGGSRRYECHMLRRDGEARLVSVTNTPIRHAGQVIGVMGVARDVTDERRLTEQLLRSEARYTRLVESASDAIITVDAEGNFVSVNRALERATGHPREALIGRPFTTVVDPRDHEICWQLFRATSAGERQRGEFRYVSTSGAVRQGSIITAPVVEDGRVVGGLGVIRDITDERRLTEQLLQQEKLAAIGQLISGVAHELNNPLAGVIAFSQLLLAKSGLPAEQHGAVETIHQEARRAAKIVSNLLTFARQHPPEQRETDLNQVLMDTIEFRRYALHVRGVALDVALDANLPRTWADPFQLQQVFLQLIGNAEHALAAWGGEKRLSIRTARRAGLLVVEVQDSGGGIAPQNIDRIFNPFFTTKPVGQGSGLGLSISDGIVREHGGRIRVESRPGEGATFVVELPLVAPPDGPAAAPEQPPVFRGRSHTVLVVDDEPSIRLALTSYLASAGHEAVAVGTGAEALEAVRSRRFDAVLLDLRMPDMSGDAVYVAIQARDPAQAERVVFLTGDVESEPSRAFIAATGRPCVTKPFTLDELARLLFVEMPS